MAISFIDPAHLLAFMPGLSSGYGWVVLMGFLVSFSAGLLGMVLMLRRMALFGDVMSHSILPGIVCAFLITGSKNIWAMLIGAWVAGLISCFLIEAIHRYSRLKPDAALAVVFSTAFSLGILLLSAFADQVDLDLDCVLFGEIAFVPLAPTIEWLGLSMPSPVVEMASVCALEGLLLCLFFKEIISTTFDPVLAQAQGLPVHAIHYGLMSALAFVIIFAFEAVGAILVIAMLIFPMATARLWCERFCWLIVLIGVLSFIYATLGLYVALCLDCSIAGAMGVVAFLLFLLSWGLKNLKLNMQST